MNKHLSLIATFSLLMFSQLSFSTTLLVAYEDKDNPPFYYSANSSLIKYTKSLGVTVEVLNVIAKKLGITINYVRLPWARGLRQLELNEIDGLFHASFKKARMKNGVYPMKGGQPDTSRMIMTQKYSLYKHQDSNIDWDGKQFKGLSGSIGAVLNYAIVGDLKKLGVSVDEASHLLSLLNRLEKNRLAGVANLDNMTDNVIKKHAGTLKNIVKVEPPLKEKPYYLMFSHDFIKNNKHLAESIWDAIKSMNLSGEYQRILQGYQ